MPASTAAWSSRSNHYRFGRNYNRGAPVATAVITIGAASAVRSAMKADATSTSD